MDSGSAFEQNSRVNVIDGYCLVRPEDLYWRLSNLMKIPNADYLERTGSEILGARLWRLPPRSANTLHRHIRSEEFYIVLEGEGRMRINDTTLTVPRHGGVLVGPSQLRQVFNDSPDDTLWLIIGAPEEPEAKACSGADMSLFYPVDPQQLPSELMGCEWPPQDSPPVPLPSPPVVVDWQAHARDWVSAWNSHDIERILTYYAADAELISPFVSPLTGRCDGIVRGISGLRDYFSRGLRAYPTLHFELIGVYPGVVSCVLEYVSVGGLRAMETMEFNGRGQIRRVLAHYRPNTL